MASTPLSTLISLADFLQLPETKPASEYIDGNIYQKIMPKGKHSAVQTFLAPAINQITIPKKIARAFTELRCTFGGRSIVPDISVFNWELIPLDDNGEIQNEFTIPPNWTIEILSPEQSSTRVINNILFCLKHGTELGWLIDPQERLIMTFLPNQLPEVQQNQDILPVLNALTEWKISVEDIFSCLRLN
ncbi:Uma2 family endonuclease [Cylindrospermum sp. FACHB-282]|uniref:Uma2 family endonuclease n=1 Tax=Cylindrospermum sp. FACHB-282 TaxID=2692794 RepID=UPI001685A5BB|nr:Uma2 family endonuclease [Cylindrospermum sp. FACHB-282]MBD2384747.1 Uma2 family endonuclease [Cylindrospermum sp. FACHB-282]